MFAFKKMCVMAMAGAALCACSVMPAGQGGSDGLAAAAEKLRLVMIDPDRAKLDALIAEELSYGHSGGKVDSKTSFMADLLSGASDFVSIEITGQTVKVTQNVGIIRHTLSAQRVA